MKNIETTFPKLAFAIATRAALAFGVGLLVSPRLSEERRRTLGKALIAIGALTTIPAALAIFRGPRIEDGHDHDHEFDHEDEASGFNGGSARESVRTTEVPIL
jgi:hypothetical protein